MLFHDVCFKDTTWIKHMHFAQMQWRINWTFIFWVQNRHVNLRPRRLKTKKNIQPLKTKHPAPKAHSLLPGCSLWTQDACIMKKGCVWKPCREQTTLIIIVINYHHQFFPTRKLRHGFRTDNVCTMRRGL